MIEAEIDAVLGVISRDVFNQIVGIARAICPWIEQLERGGRIRADSELSSVGFGQQVEDGMAN
jgi:hypothetical protein